MQELSLVAIVICVMIGFFTIVLCGFSGGVFLYLRSKISKPGHRSNNQRTHPTNYQKTDSKTDQRFVPTNIINISPKSVPQRIPNDLAKPESPETKDNQIDMFSQIFKVLNMLEMVSKIYSGFAGPQPNPQESIPQSGPVGCGTMAEKNCCKCDPKPVESTLSEQKSNNEKELTKSTKPKSSKPKKKPVDAQTMAITNLTLQMSKVLDALNSVSQVNANLVTAIQQQQPKPVDCSVSESNDQNIVDEPKNEVKEPIIPNMINGPFIQESNPALEIYNIEDIV